MPSSPTLPPPTPPSGAPQPASPVCPWAGGKWALLACTCVRTHTHTRTRTHACVRLALWVSNHPYGLSHIAMRVQSFRTRLPVCFCVTHTLAQTRTQMWDAGRGAACRKDENLEPELHEIWRKHPLHNHWRQCHQPANPWSTKK
jgi:hypothetical protein